MPLQLALQQQSELALLKAVDAGFMVSISAGSQKGSCKQALSAKYLLCKQVQSLLSSAGLTHLIMHAVIQACSPYKTLDAHCT